MKIAVYGGSFNPPHLGHAEAAAAVAEALKPDKLLIIPAGIPPHKELDANSADAQRRMLLSSLAFEDIPNAEISDMELLRGGKSYSSDTVEELLRLYPDAEIYFAMGTDMLLSFEKWHRFEYLLKNMTLAVFSRDGGEDGKIAGHAEYLRRSYGARTVLVRHEPKPMSSTEIRSLLPQRRGRELLPDKVYAEIIRNGDYGAKPELQWLREKAYAMLKPKRIPHVRGCEEEAVRLAERWGADKTAAAEAGILHDITKKLLMPDQLILCEKYDIINDNCEKENLKLLHAKTGAAVARDLFNVSDEVCEAIRWHTTGKPHMSLLEKIIYMADYIEPNRDFEGVDKLRELAYKNLDEAMLLGLEMSLEDIRSSGYEPYIVTAEACRWFEETVKISGQGQKGIT
ncbi:MAG: nicotinate (nicotinamide) nucleotide adenylyltransferase [Oscillospiraceae bacterium]|nr:nicotinate (nicotinamide) nucleotide adenylyltransferase [Oscillospiraceae bacterium]